MSTIRFVKAQAAHAAAFMAYESDPAGNRYPDETERLHQRLEATRAEFDAAYAEAVELGAITKPLPIDVI